MKIAVFGASGPTGRHLVEQALNIGFQVTAFVRNPGIFDISHSDLTVIQADVLVPSTFENKLSGHNAVLSALGTRRGIDEINLYSAGGKNIIEAMKAAGVKRFICLTSGGVVDDESSSKIISEAQAKTLQNNVQRDMKRLEDYLKTINAVEWIVIRPPGLLNSKFTGNYQVFDKHIPNIGRRISRADLADFMIKQITDNTYLFKYVTLAY